MAQIFELDIPSTEKLVLLAMADHARDDGTGCYPSIDRLARKSSLTRRGVQKIIRRLEDAGLAVPTERFSGRHQLTTEYRISLGERGEQGSLVFRRGRTPEHNGANVVRGGANQDAQRGEPCSPESSGTIIETPKSVGEADVSQNTCDASPNGDNGTLSFENFQKQAMVDRLGHRELKGLQTVLIRSLKDTRLPEPYRVSLREQLSYVQKCLRGAG